MGGALAQRGVDPADQLGERRRRPGCLDGMGVAESTAKLADATIEAGRSGFHGGDSASFW